MGDVLVLDCYLDSVGGARNVVPHLSRYEVVRVAHETVPGRCEARAVVVTGSAASVLDGRSWTGELEALVDDAVSRGLPVLGLCFGHQVLARVLWGSDAVRKSPRPELGWEEVERTADDPLFAGVPERFRCFVSHGDEVDPERLGPDARVLASTRDCTVHAFRAGDRPLWGVQFHAEMGLVESEELVRARAERHGIDAERVLARRIATEELAASLFQNFLTAAGLR
jgi:GMP synthase (glutamine-hydrolysing)